MTLRFSHTSSKLCLGDEELLLVVGGIGEFYFHGAVLLSLRTHAWAPLTIAGGDGGGDAHAGRVYRHMHAAAAVGPTSVCVHGGMRLRTQAAGVLMYDLSRDDAGAPLPLLLQPLPLLCCCCCCCCCYCCCYCCCCCCCCYCCRNAP